MSFVSVCHDHNKTWERQGHGEHIRTVVQAMYVQICSILYFIMKHSFICRYEYACNSYKPKSYPRCIIAYYNYFQPLKESLLIGLSYIM
jgi:hypothetical protein